MARGKRRKTKNEKRTNTVVVDSPTAVVFEEVVALAIDVLEVVILLKNTNDDSDALEVVILLENTNGDSDVGIGQGLKVDPDKIIGRGTGVMCKLTNKEAGVAAVQGESVRNVN